MFGPVWSTLYLLMGGASLLVWRHRATARRGQADRALMLYGLQLTLNLAWSWVFFGARQPGWALAEIAALWTSVAATTVAFAGVDRRAAAALVPYLGWVTFATVLNAEIVRLERDRGS